jgi:hypothetical protein
MLDNITNICTKLINKSQAIISIEADSNAANKVIFRELMPNQVWKYWFISEEVLSERGRMADIMLSF